VARSGAPADLSEEGDEYVEEEATGGRGVPAAVTAAAAGQWRALRQVARLAMVGRTSPDDLVGHTSGRTPPGTDVDYVKEINTIARTFYWLMNSEDAATHLRDHNTAASTSSITGPVLAISASAVMDTPSLLAECDARWVEARRTYWRRTADMAGSPLLSSLQEGPADTARLAAARATAAAAAAATATAAATAATAATAAAAATAATATAAATAATAAATVMATAVAAAMATAAPREELSVAAAAEPANARIAAAVARSAAEFEEVAEGSEAAVAEQAAAAAAAAIDPDNLIAAEELIDIDTTTAIPRFTPDVDVSDGAHEGAADATTTTAAIDAMIAPTAFATTTANQMTTTAADLRWVDPMDDDAVEAVRQELIRNIADDAGASPHGAGVPAAAAAAADITGAGINFVRNTVSRSAAGAGDTKAPTLPVGGASIPMLADLLRGDPFALFVELLTRLGSAAPGLLGGDEGLVHAEAVARVVTVAVVVQSAVTVGFQIVTSENAVVDWGNEAELAAAAQSEASVNIAATAATLTARDPADDAATAAAAAVSTSTAAAATDGASESGVAATAVALDVDVHGGYTADEAMDMGVDSEARALLKRAYSTVLRALHPDAPRGGRGGAIAEAVSRHAASTLWRIETLLELLDGAATPPPSPHAAFDAEYTLEKQSEGPEGNTRERGCLPPSGVAGESRALACASRLLRRLGLGGPDGTDLAGVVSLLRVGVGTVVAHERSHLDSAGLARYFNRGTAEGLLHRWCHHLTPAPVPAAAPVATVFTPGTVPVSTRTDSAGTISSGTVSTATRTVIAGMVPARTRTRTVSLGMVGVASRLAPRRPRLIPLPRRCEDLFLRMIDHPCKRCGTTPRDPALCLVCGELVCCAVGRFRVFRV